MPTAPTAITACEASYEVAEVAPQQVVEADVEAAEESRWSCTEETDVPIINSSGFEDEEDVSVDGRLVWADEWEKKEDSQRYSEWVNKWAVRVTDADSIDDGRRESSRNKNRIGKMQRRPKCLRRLGRLVLRLSRCFGCTRPLVHQRATSDMSSKDRIEISSVESVFCT